MPPLCVSYVYEIQFWVELRITRFNACFVNLPTDQVGNRDGRVNLDWQFVQKPPHRKDTVRLELAGVEFHVVVASVDVWRDDRRKTGKSIMVWSGSGFI